MSPAAHTPNGVVSGALDGELGEAARLTRQTGGILHVHRRGSQQRTS